MTRSSSARWGTGGGLPPTCSRVVVDVARVGDGCTSQAAGQVYCDSGTGYCDSGAAGTPCVALPDEGQPCHNQDCAVELYCNDGTCQPQHYLGSCTEADDCEVGLVCLEGTCRPPLQLGDACDPSAHACPLARSAAPPPARRSAPRRCWPAPTAAPMATAARPGRALPVIAPAPTRWAKGSPALATSARQDWSATGRRACA
jgi:hypothetical protein